MRQLYTDYIDSGTVRFSYAHAAFLGPFSASAAEASECAGEQGKFWEYHDTLFQHVSTARLTEEGLYQYAEDLRLDVDAFGTCYEEGKYKVLVYEQTQLAGQVGIRSIPHFILNDQDIVGAQGMDVFKMYIEEALKVQ